MEKIKGPVIEEVLQRAADQEHPKHEGIAREITLLWDRVRGLADDRATRGQLLMARQVSHTRHQELKDRVSALSNRLEASLANAANYREALEDAMREHDNRLGTLEDLEIKRDHKGHVVRTAKFNALKRRVNTLEDGRRELVAAVAEEFENQKLRTRSLWDHFKGWG